MLIEQSNSQLKEITTKPRKFKPYLTIPKGLKYVLQGKCNLLCEKSKFIIKKKTVKKRIELNDLGDLSSIDNEKSGDNNFTMLERMSPLYKKNMQIKFDSSIQLQEMEISTEPVGGFDMGKGDGFSLKKELKANKPHYLNKKEMKRKIEWDHDVYDIYNPVFTSEEERLESPRANKTVVNTEDKIEKTEKISKYSERTVKIRKPRPVGKIKSQKLFFVDKPYNKIGSSKLLQRIRTFGEDLKAGHFRENQDDNKKSNTSLDIVRAKGNREKIGKRHSAFNIKLNSLKKGDSKTKNEFIKRKTFNYTEKLIRSYNLYKVNKTRDLNVVEGKKNPFKKKLFVKKKEPIAMQF